MGAILGIDLGTTFSAVAVIDETGRPKIVHDSEGKNITPSCVTIRDDGVVEVGEYARKTWGNDPSMAAARFKRQMGTGDNISIGGQSFTPTELSSLVLKQLVSNATKETGEVSEIVVTIPANFSNEARKATMAAATAAGLEIRYIINEPTAAALYYAFKSGEELGGIYAVYDLGGGTFDVSIIRVDGQNIEVITSNGIHKLGGDDFDKVLLGVVEAKYSQETGSHFDPEDFTILDAEEEKKSLSRRKRTTAKVGKKLIDLSREEFEEAISSLVAQTEMLCESTIEEAEIDVSEIRQVFLAGGSTRIPMVRESVARVFGREPIDSVNVDEVVALGAALYAAYKSDHASLSPVQRNTIAKIQVAEVTNHCYGVITLSWSKARDDHELQNAILIQKNEKIPCEAEQSFYTVHDGQEEVACKLTQSTAAEKDPQFVNVIWEGALPLPPGRPAEQEIQVIFSYSVNQTMECTFKDVESGNLESVDLQLSEGTQIDLDRINQFTVE